MIKIVITQADVKKNLKIRDILAAQSGDMFKIIDILARFVQDDNGEMLSPEAGKEVILDLTVEELEAATKAFYSAVTDQSVPPVNATS